MYKKDKVFMQCRGGKTGFKGKATLQLTDGWTGRIKESVETNIGTNFLNHGLNAFKKLEGVGESSYNDQKHAVLNGLIPVTGGAVMGIMLFSDNMPELPDYCSRPDYFTNLVGHAGGAYAGDSKFRGTFVAPESYPIFKNSVMVGYRIVHTWLTSVATGLIKSLALTSILGGNGLTGSRLNSITDTMESAVGFGAFNTDPANFNTDSRIGTGSSYTTGSWKTADFLLNPSIGTWALQTSKPLCWKQNSNNTISIWLMAYNTTESALILYRCDSPAMQGFSPFSSVADVRNFRATEIWRTPTINNIHASMFYFDGQYIRCTRCTDTSDLAAVNFEDMRIALDGLSAPTSTFSFASSGNFWGANITAATPANTQTIMCKCAYVTGSGNFLCTPLISTLNRGRTVILNPGNGNVLWAYDFYLSTTSNVMGTTEQARYKQFINGALLLPGANNMTYSGSPLAANSFLSLIVHDKIQGMGYSGLGSSNGYSNFYISGANPPIIIPSVDNSAAVISADWRGTTAMTAPINIAFNSNYLATINNLETPIVKGEEDVLKTIYDITFEG